MPSVTLPRKAKPSTDLNLNNKTCFKLSPNPVKDYLNIEFELIDNYKGASLKISTQLGEIIQTYPIENNVRNIVVETKGMTIGVYYVQLVLDKQVKETQKFVIQ